MNSNKSLKTGILVLLAPVVAASYYIYKEWKKLDEPIDFDLDAE